MTWGRGLLKEYTLIQHYSQLSSDKQTSQKIQSVTHMALYTIIRDPIVVNSQGWLYCFRLLKILHAPKKQTASTFHKRSLYKRPVLCRSYAPSTIYDSVKNFLCISQICIILGQADFSHPRPHPFLPPPPLISFLPLSITCTRISKLRRLGIIFTAQQTSVTVLKQW